MIVADGVKMREGETRGKFRSDRHATPAKHRTAYGVKRLTLTPGSVLHGAHLMVLEQRHGSRTRCVGAYAER